MSSLTNGEFLERLETCLMKHVTARQHNRTAFVGAGRIPCTPNTIYWEEKKYVPNNLHAKLSSNKNAFQ